MKFAQLICVLLACLLLAPLAHAGVEVTSSYQSSSTVTSTSSGGSTGSFVGRQRRQRHKHVHRTTVSASGGTNSYRHVSVMRSN